MRSEIGASITEARTLELDERLEVGGDRAREAPDLRPQAGRGDQPDRLPVLGRDAREAGLDAVDAEPVEQARDLELLGRVEDDADGLLAVAQRRVVEPDAAAEAVVVVERAGPDQLAHSAATTPSGKAESFSAPAARDQEVVLDAQAAAALPVAARLDREHHPLLDLAAAGLVGVGRLVRARADAVADRVGGLAGEARLGDAGADEPVELGEARARAGSGRPRAS